MIVRRVTRTLLVCSALSIALMAPAAGRTRAHSPARSGPAAVAAANAAGTREPVRSGFLNASAISPFVEGTLYRVYAAPERVTDIVLQAGEVLNAVASGDTARWVIGDTASGLGADKRVHILVKPVAAGLATNLVITTDRRTYHVSLTSRSGPAMASLSWSYPQDELIALQRAQAEAASGAAVAADFDLQNLRFDYAIDGGHPPWRPLRAFDDGRQTYIEFPASLSADEAPPLFLVGRKGEAQLVNYRLRGRYYVVDRLFDAAELRLGTKKRDAVRIRRLGAGKARSHHERDAS